MSARRLSLITVLCLVPSVVFAQRGGGGGRSRSGGDASGQSKGPDASGIMLAKDLEDENPVAVIIDSRKDLKLTDDELKDLKTMNNLLKDSVKARVHVLDSIQHALRETGPDGPSPGQRLAGTSFATGYIASVRADFDVALKVAMAKLTEEQQAGATAALEKKKAKSSRRGGGSAPR